MPNSDGRFHVAIAPKQRQFLLAWCYDSKDDSWPQVITHCRTNVVGRQSAFFLTCDQILRERLLENRHGRLMKPQISGLLEHIPRTLIEKGLIVSFRR